MRISDWSSDVCSSDLEGGRRDHRQKVAPRNHDHGAQERGHSANSPMASARASASKPASTWRTIWTKASWSAGRAIDRPATPWPLAVRSEEHTSELQSLMRNSYAVFCLKKKNKRTIKAKDT